MTVSLFATIVKPVVAQKPVLFHGNHNPQSILIKVLRIPEMKVMTNLPFSHLRILTDLILNEHDHRIGDRAHVLQC